MAVSLFLDSSSAWDRTTSDPSPAPHWSENKVFTGSWVTLIYLLILVTSYPPKNAVFGSRCFQTFFLAIWLIPGTHLALGIAKTNENHSKIIIFGHLLLDATIWTGPGINDQKSAVYSWQCFASYPLPPKSKVIFELSGFRFAIGFADLSDQISASEL